MKNFKTFIFYNKIKNRSFYYPDYSFNKHEKNGYKKMLLKFFYEDIPYPFLIKQPYIVLDELNNIMTPKSIKSFWNNYHFNIKNLSEIL